jgi:ATP-binding cassette, subfamily C, bacterial
VTTFAFMRRLLREQPVRFSLAVSALALAGLLESAGVATIIPLLDLVSKNGAEQSSTIGLIVAGGLSAVHLPLDLATVLAVGLLLIVLQQVVLLVQQKIVAGSIYGFEASLRNKLYENVFSADWLFFVRQRTSDLVNALTAEAARGAGAYGYLNQMLSALFVVVAYVGLALLISWQMTLFVAVIGLTLAFLLRNRVARGSKFGAAITSSNSLLQREAQENIAGAKLVKGCAVERSTVERFANEVDKLANVEYRAQMNQAWVRAIYDSTSVAAVFLGIYIATQRFNMSIPTLVVFLLMFYRVSPRISNIQQLQHLTLSFVPGIEKVDELTAEAEQAEERRGGTVAARFTDAIRFDDVDFSYDGRTKVVRGLSIAIPRGEMVAVVGPSGAGKTTVIDMVMALISPTSGCVTVDGVPLDTTDVRAWRRRIAYVPQDPVLFHASVRENLVWGTEGADDAAVKDASRLAFADEFIGELPEGYDTVVGDRGMRLSGGQKQRLALARAILRRPEVLILDEATSALDAESEQKIQQAIERVSGDITVLVVTHRLATVKNADLIYVLEDGRLVEQGSWAELTARRGRFFEIKQLQDLDQVNKEPMTDG